MATEPTKHVNGRMWPPGLYWATRMADPSEVGRCSVRAF